MARGYHVSGIGSCKSYAYHLFSTFSGIYFMLRNFKKAFRMRVQLFSRFALNSHFIAGVQLGGGGGRPSLPFFENPKKCTDFGKKVLNCVHPWVESSMQNVILRVSRRKSSNILPCGAFFLCVFDKSLSKCPNCIKPPLP